MDTDCHENGLLNDIDKANLQLIVEAVNEHSALLAVAEANQELIEAVNAMDTSYQTSDFLPGDKSRRYYNALKAAEIAQATLSAIREGRNPHTGETESEKETRIAKAFGIREAVQS